MDPESLKNIDRLNQLLPDLRGRGMDLGLYRIKKALDIMGQPCSSIPAIHIVGTNGKGSIASFIQSCLIDSDISVGTTTSPHLINWRERININGENISDTEFIQILNNIILKTNHLKLTTFELVILSALSFFEDCNAQIIILETGLGGRLDATTAHPSRPIIAMGGIGLDHCEHLGHNLEQITKEKADVITPGSVVISAKQHPQVTKVLEETVKRKHAKLKWVEPLGRNWKLGLKGEIQRENAAVAKAALEELSNIGFFLEGKSIRTGLSNARWKGRLETAFFDGFPVLLDGAHNAHAAKQLCKERQKWPEQENGINWLLAIQSNKDGPLILKELIKQNDIAWIIEVPNHKSWKAKELLHKCPELSNQIIEGKNTKEVLKLINSQRKSSESSPVISGSLYLIGNLFKEKVITESPI